MCCLAIAIRLSSPFHLKLISGTTPDPSRTRLSPGGSLATRFGLHRRVELSIARSCRAPIRFERRGTSEDATVQALIYTKGGLREPSIRTWY